MILIFFWLHENRRKEKENKKEKKKIRSLENDTPKSSPVKKADDKQEGDSLIVTKWMV